MKIAAALLFSTLATLSFGACKHEEPAVAGVGKYKFTTTKLKNVHDGQCQPTDLDDGRKGTWCFQLPGFKVGKSSIAEMDLYFLGTDPDASLIEILLKVRGCDETELDQWMRTAFGPPLDSKSTREYWKNKYLFAAALMPSEPARCVVHLLPLSEVSEIERIKQL